MNITTPLAFAYEDWTVWVVLAAVVAAVFALKHATVISAEAARKLLAEGGKVIDVRTEREFQQRHIPGVVHLPLSRLPGEIEALVPDKNTPLLLHCLSGARSGAGVRALKGLGYTRVYNLGSYGRAERLMKSAKG